MLENARRQLFLVLLSIVAALVVTFTMKIPLGHDLKGGTQLRYEVPKEALEAINQRQGTSIDKMMEDSIKVITERIDPNGVLDPLITRSGDTGILIELPWFENPAELDAVLARIGNLGKLEFRMVADDDFIKEDVKFNMATEKAALQAWLRRPDNAQLIREDYRNIRRYNEGDTSPAHGNIAWYPRLIRPDTSGKHKDKDLKFWEHRYSEGPLAASVVPAYDDKEWNNGVVPDEVQKLPPAQQLLVEFIALNMKETHFEGKDLDPGSVGSGPAPEGGVGVNYAFDAGHSSAYADWSEKYKGKASAIVLNGVVKSAPTFQGKITGTGIITGDFTMGEVDELVKVLKTGSLRVEPILLSKNVIGPTLGSESIHRGLISLATGGALVFVFMIWYYGIAGTIACAMLLLNLLMLWAAMLFMQATITLPGLGGIVLTLGMAVDANVLIYERIREERENGKDILRAVRAGFERAMSAIMDSNVASFLAALVLYSIGTGPVRGFAVTLMIGIVTTLFTQFFVTRIAFHIALERKWLDNWHPHSLLTKANIDFVHYMRMNVTISILMVLGGVLFALFGVPREEMLGMDFTGGANLEMAVSQPMDADEVRGVLSRDADFNREYPNCTVNTVGKLGQGDRALQFNLRLKLTDSQRARIEQERKEWSEARKKAEATQEQAPAAYEPPYQARLRQVFSQQLVKPAFSEPLTTPLPNDDRMQFAQVYLHFQEPIALADARQKVSDAKLPQAVVSVPGDKDAVTSKDVLLEWHTLASTRDWELFDIARTALSGLKTPAGNHVVLSNPFPAAQEIQGRLVYDLRNAAIGALILSWLLIGLYLRVRFHDYSFGIAAVLSLIHDVAIAFGAIVVANHFHLVHAELDLNMVACFLTIIGYSVNDTIVIFDRIREVMTQNRRLGRVEAFRDVINHAINKTLSRTVLTHGVTMFVVIAQFFVNLGSASDLESFAFGMIIGIVTGTYSSIFIAAPILIWLHKDELDVPGHPIAPAATSTPAQAPAS